MDDLIQRLKDASEGSRELDALVEQEHRRLRAYAVGLDDKIRAYWEPDAKGNVSSQGTTYAAPDYTASIDAAMTLVNEYGCDLYVRPPMTTARTYLSEDDDAKAVAKTPALALCIAALSAHKHGSAEHE